MPGKDIYLERADLLAHVNTFVRVEGGLVDINACLLCNKWRHSTLNDKSIIVAFW
jgi:hypothetical protein